MKSVAVSIILAAMAASGAVAADYKKPLPTDANVPTGSDVPGCTNYRIYPGGKTEQVCNPNDIRELLKDLQSNTVGAYTSAFSSPGSSDGASQ